ncbi:3,5-bisphosphate nucleotidase [Gigaspora margarita]|uniref:3,5-bisphosphate nucleotidase n=1 Tax=Gigaspora margarita TaxID=4874 RepID=A0A8H4B5I7_GIGMA|nr:3,5-bisphosphate nucleotidase [Gigaspora margarita]
MAKMSRNNDYRGFNINYAVLDEIPQRIFHIKHLDSLCQVYSFATERAVAIDAVLRASKICQKVFNNLITKDIIIKGDKTPVTIADFSAQAVINTILYKSFPNDPIVGEENSKKLQGDRMWTVDPVDGTKGFIRGGDYAVGISLIIDGEVHLSVIGCPNFLVNFKVPESKKGCLFIAVKGQGAFQRSFYLDKETQIYVTDILSPSEALICESFVAKHPSLSKVASILGITKEPLHIDKKIWDHAPGYLLVKEAGGIVADMDNKPLDFTLGRQLKTNRRIVVAGPKIHEQVVCAVQQTITKEK